MSIVISKADIENMNSRFRATFINSIEGFKSFNLVATRSKAGISNVAPFNSIMHIGSNPPLIGMLIRPETDEHQTLNNIRETKGFTINHVNENILQKAHQTSAKYDSNTSEFEACGLTEQISDHSIAPYVKESNLKYTLTLKEIVPIALNGMNLVIGEIQEVLIGECNIEDDGYVHIDELGTLTCVGVDSYFKVNNITRLPYAKK